MPVFTRDNSVTHDDLWWIHEGNRAIRVDKWKLVATRDDPWELYDLDTDRAETKNLAAQYPEKVRNLERTWTLRMNQFRKLAAPNP